MMLADHTLSMKAVPADAYELKRAVYGCIDTTGVPVGRDETRSFIYGRCPIDGSVLVRSRDERLATISTEIRMVPQPKNGDLFDFCLRATPITQSKFGAQPTEPESWLRARADKIGIEIVAVHYRSVWTWCSKLTKETMKGFFMPDVVYLGRLSVTDADLLANALETGIGRHRAFGFGLMQLFQE